MKRFLPAFLRKALDPNAKIRNRGLVVFPASSPMVSDHADHFPINDEDQARNALARVAAYDSTPPWYRGYSVSELKAHVRSMVAHHYPDISVDLHPESKSAKAKRRITYAKVTHVSLVSRGANKMPVLMKSGGRVQFNMLFKNGAEEGLLHALVYVPEENGAVDTEGDVAPRAVVKQMAHDFIANGAHLDVEHDLVVLSPEEASVAETFIVQKGDARFDGWVDNYGAAVDPEGAWGMVIKVSDPGLRKAVKDGRIAGVSLFGLAEVEPIVKSTSILETMNEAQLKALLDGQTASLVEAITKAMTPKVQVTPPAPVVPPAPPVEVPAIKFEGNPLDPKAVAAHKEKLFLASLDLSKSADVEKLETYLQAKGATPAVKTAATGAAPSNQPVGDPPAPPAEKDEATLLKSGAEFGKKINKVLGR